METLELSVSQFVEVFNQTMSVAYPEITIVGELANFRVSKNRWLYFDLKDETSSVKFFGTVYQLPGPLEDGMLLKVKAAPRLHNNYGFSLSVINIMPSGEGSIKKAANLLKDKLTKEGLFDDSRKRLVPYPPTRVGLITSKQSAAYADFIKIINARWHGVLIELIDVQVQGEAAPEQLVQAIEQINSRFQPPDVAVLIRGGGSPEDLAAYSSEMVTRAVASSRVPTLVAVGHEIDISLAELAADLRASTPSNAAELLVPDKHKVLEDLGHKREALKHQLKRSLNSSTKLVDLLSQDLDKQTSNALAHKTNKLELVKRIINAYNPSELLKIGYAIVRDQSGHVLRSSKELSIGDIVNVTLKSGGFEAKVNKLR